MSKNLAEPSTQRFIAGHGYNIRNLTRRPSNYNSQFGPWPTGYNYALFTTYGCLDANAFNWDRIDEAPATNTVHRATLNNYRRNIGGSVATRTATDGDYFVFGGRFGPQFSIWYIASWHLLGPNFGNISLYFYGALTENDDGTVTPIIDDIENNGDWILADTQGAGQPYGLGYGAAEHSDIFCDPFFILTGPDGAVATTYVPPLAPGDDYSTDGGAGLYYIKMQINGKSASSSGYRGAVSELTMKRGSDTATPGFLG